MSPAPRLVLALLLTACVSGASLDDPPELVVRSAEFALRLEPITYCWNTGRANLCVDRDLPDPLPNLGNVEGRIEVEWPLESWDFYAVLIDPVHRDEETLVEEPLRGLGNGVWAIDPTANDGVFQIEVFGYGPEGDVYVVFIADLVGQPDLRAPAPFFSFLA